MPDYLIAFIVCVVAALVEGLCAGREPMAQLKALRQPAWSPPGWLWVLIAIGWYGICFISLARLLSFWPQEKLPVVLLAALMLANAAANIFAFRMRRLDLAFFFFLPYALLLAAFLWAACPLDSLTCGLFAFYALYLVYAAAWGWKLWRLNPP